MHLAFYTGWVERNGMLISGRQGGLQKPQRRGRTKSRRHQDRNFLWTRRRSSQRASRVEQQFGLIHSEPRPIHDRRAVSGSLAEAGPGSAGPQLVTVSALVATGQVAPNQRINSTGRWITD